MGAAGSGGRESRSACSGCRIACGGCWAGLVTAKPSKAPEEQKAIRWVWHGGLPMLTTDVTEGGLPNYVGLINQDEMSFGSVQLRMETWPNYRIGSSIWPSGALLGKALAEGLPGLPEVRGKHVAELGAGPGIPGLVSAKLGAASVTMTDLVELVPLMRKNIELNGLEGNCFADTLDWTMSSDSPLSVSNRGKAGEGPLDVVLGADIVYFEEQEPLMDAIDALMAPRHTILVLAYKERTGADRAYLNERILPRLEEVTRTDYEAGDVGQCEIYVGRMR